MKFKALKKFRPTCFLKITVQVLVFLLAIVAVCTVVSFLMRHIAGIIALALLVAVIAVLEFFCISMK